MTADEAIQDAIKNARIPIVRRSLRHKYEADPELFRKNLAAIARMNGDGYVADSLEANAEIDPEKLAKWLEILLRLLPLVLLLF